MWQVIIHPLVYKQDFKNIPKQDHFKLVKAIRKKLMKDPHAYGKKLSGFLKDFYRLRVDDYRVIYAILNLPMGLFPAACGVVIVPMGPDTPLLRSKRRA